MDELRSKVSSLERERDELKSRTESSTGGRESGLMETFEKFIEAQTKMMSAHAKIVAVQNFPPLPPFIGEEIDCENKSFVKWHERFEERAALAGWDNEQKLHQLKFHLGKNALRVFEMLPESERKVYASAVGTLKKRFRPIDIEELRGLEFNQKMQTSESVEQLGIDLMSLGRKAFPKICEAEFDRMLKGRFFQALLPKWQRKLGAPKIDEKFNDLYDRARVIERREKQYLASASARSEGKDKKRDQGAKQSNGSSNESVSPKETDSEDKGSSTNGSSQGRSQRSSRTCFFCGEVGHYKRDCPKKKREATGRHNGRSSLVIANTVEGTESGDPLSSFSDAQLEAALAERKLYKEQELLNKTTVSAVNATGEVHSPVEVGALGHTLCLDITVEGVQVEALVDSCSEVTITSRSLLHEIGKCCKEKGRPLPQLVVPSLALYGKSDKQLEISAQLTVSMETDGKSVMVPVFVQPHSDQKCLLGMNACPALGVSFTDGKGVPLKEHISQGSEMTGKVYLVQTCSIPRMAGKFLEARVEPGLREREIIFEPCGGLAQKSLSAPESLIVPRQDGTVLIPMQNFGETAVTLTRGVELGSVAPLCLESKFPRPEELEKCFTSLVTSTPSVDRKALLEPVLKVGDDSMQVQEMAEVKELLLEANDLFELEDNELGCTGVVKHQINTEGHYPIKQPMRRTPFVQREQIAEMVQCMEQQGIVKPSASPWSSPIVLVPKKDGTTRFCIHYRRLNAITKKDVYPLPRVDDILDTLGGCKYFSTLDLSSGYWQIEMDSESAEKTAFSTHCGLFEFTRMPFGLCNGPATFQRLMEIVLAGLEWKCCVVYVDDILVCSKTLEEHKEHLQQVFERLRQAGLKLKPSKCSFLCREVVFLGHVISVDGVSPDPAKTEKVRDYPVPVDVSSVRQFLGLASYYRRFVPGFSKIAAPLYVFSKKSVTFSWTDECQKAFDQLKQLLCSAPVLAYPLFGPEHQFIVETDASVLGLGAVLFLKAGKWSYPSNCLCIQEPTHPQEKLRDNRA